MIKRRRRPPPDARPHARRPRARSSIRPPSSRRSRRAFREAAAGRAAALPRAVLPIAQGRRLPRHDLGAAAPAGARAPSSSPCVGRRTAARGLPTLHASYVLVDPETGAPLAFMEAGFLTAIRTGAASGRRRPVSRAPGFAAPRLLRRGSPGRVPAPLPPGRPALESGASSSDATPPARRPSPTRMRDALGMPVEVTRDRRAAVARRPTSSPARRPRRGPSSPGATSGPAPTWTPSAPSGPRPARSTPRPSGARASSWTRTTAPGPRRAIC